MINVMIDLETWSTSPNASIRSIGACKFNEGGIASGVFYENISDSESNGLHVNECTRQWWSRQSQQAREALLINPKPLEYVLEEFAMWLPDTSATLMWGNGADFDNAILANAYSHFDLAMPWNFYNNRCYRTVKNLFPIVTIIRTGEKHNAIEDAISQANHLIQIRSKAQFEWNIDLFNPEKTIESLTV